MYNFVASNYNIRGLTKIALKGPHSCGLPYIVVKCNACRPMETILLDQH